ncbi:MAG: glyceraldehyde 3-phosphate dehydrogenase [archaeon GW2011_AR9]|nr:MAG: glyceraldehyde 3-phosphate dehydrogenase [archaeon GW2011_AR9]MBS3121003.1 type I glyceraldehyde-3-phosphate dehydrogenase [Candidatus Woesearchaeota archaeon]HIH13507.1 type I glyceraldehyde-3-phosphate dehydrogenase [Candidatus Woesearchaeota archaeon]
MTINVAINGFGRIGRMFYRAAYKDPQINIVAVNDLTDNKTLAHLLKYDSIHNRFEENVSFTDSSLVVGKKLLKVFAEKDPSKLPWKQLKVDVVVESTGRFTKPQDAAIHLTAGARKVVISAPCKCEDNVCPIDTVTLVWGVNEKLYNKKQHHVISNASCTTNCVAPVLKVILDSVGIKRCFFTTVHAYTADQNIVDGPHKDLRRSRAAALNIVPTSSGADIATIEAIPSLKGKLRGFAMRVPVPDGSITDFTIETEKDVTPEQVNKLLQKEANGKFKGIIQYSEDELVSSDIIHNPHSAIIDSKLTNVVDRRVLKIVAWYDNEWGYSNRLVDVVKWIG